MILETNKMMGQKCKFNLSLSKYMIKKIFHFGRPKPFDTKVRKFDELNNIRVGCEYNRI